MERETTPSTPKRNSHGSNNIKLPPPHLSEFYSFVNTNNNNYSHSTTGTTPGHNVFESPISTTSETTSIGHGNPSFVSTSSNFSNYANSEFDEEEDGVVVTLRDILKSIKKYEQVIIKADNYSKLLQLVSKLSSEFGESIEELTKLKGCDEVGEDFYKSSGLQYVNSNYDLILSNLIRKNFIEPLKLKLVKFKEFQLKNDEEFQKNLKQKLNMLQIKESELKKFNKIKRKNLNMNLNKYKFNLISITNELNSIENFKRLNYQEILTDLGKFHKDVMQNLSMVIRLQLEINETILKKSWSGGGLDELISKCPDPFNEDDEMAEDLTLNNIIEEEEEEEEEDDEVHSNVNSFSGGGGVDTDKEQQVVRAEQHEDEEEDIQENSFSLPTI